MGFEISANTAFLVLIGLAVGFEIVGDIFFKKWAGEGNHWLLLIGLGIYFIGTFFWAISLRTEYLSRAVSIFTIVNLIVIAFVGVLYFKENLSVINQIGIGLGILSVILMEI